MTMTTGELDFDRMFQLCPGGTTENVVEISFFEISNTVDTFLDYKANITLQCTCKFENL